MENQLLTERATSLNLLKQALQLYTPMEETCDISIE